MTRRRHTRAIDAAIARFRLYPESSRGLYVRVIVFHDRAALKRCFREIGFRGWRTTAGYCLSYDRFRVYGRGDSRRDRRLPDFASVYVSADAMTMRIVTHELTHAAVAWGRRVGFDFASLVDDPERQGSVSNGEERFVTVVGTLCSQFMTRANALGLYELHVRKSS